MGWSFTKDATKADIVKELIRTQEENGRTWTTLAHTVRGNVLYYVREIAKEGTPTVRYIGVSLLERDRNYGWGSKDMDESMGPYNADRCPLAYLDMVPDPGNWATTWRDKVRAYHAAQTATRDNLSGLTIGDTLRLREGCTPRELTFAGRKGRSILGLVNGRQYRVPPRALAGAEIVKAG